MRIATGTLLIGTGSHRATVTYLCCLGIDGHIWSDIILEQTQNFPGFCMASQVMFGIKQVAVNRKVKNAFGAGNERESFYDVLVITEYIFRHTGGA